MTIPKSKKLADKDNDHVNVTPTIPFDIIEPMDDVVKIRPVNCQNDFIAILQTQIETTIALSNNDDSYKNEGLVIGVGPGLSDNNGGRLKPTVEIGDYVMFGARNIVQVLAPSNGHYKDKKVIIVSEKNVLCKLPSEIVFEIVE